MGQFLFVTLILLMATISFSAKMKTLHKWKYVDYVWDSPQQKKDAISSDNYKPSLCILHDVDKADDGRIFATVPKNFHYGVPASLVTVSNKTGKGGPLLRPYPNWSWHNDTNTCSNIVNVVSVHIRCNHIFVLDNGRIGNHQACVPIIWIFNLKDDKLVKNIIIPLDVATNKTGSGALVTPFVHVPGKCQRLLDEMIVFMSDVYGCGLVVHDASKKHTCRVESDFMRIKNHVNVTIENKTVNFVGGIYGLTIIRGELFYNPLTEKNIYKMKIKDLLKCPKKKTANKQTKLAGKIPIQAGPLASAKCSIFLSNWIQKRPILGTNACKQFDSDDMVVLAQDSKKLDSIFGLKTLLRHNELMALSSKYFHFVNGTVNLNEINFRIVKMNLTDVQKEIH